MLLRVAAYGILVDADDRILLTHWNDGIRQGWTLPGGGLEPGEHPEAAAVREIREETGLDARLTGLLGVDSIVVPRASDGELMQGIRIVYRAEVIGGELAVEDEGGSTDDVHWIPLDELEALDRVELVDAGVAFWRADATKGHPHSG